MGTHLLSQEAQGLGIELGVTGDRYSKGHFRTGVRVGADCGCDSHRRHHPKQPVALKKNASSKGVLN